MCSLSYAVSSVIMTMLGPFIVVSDVDSFFLNLFWNYISCASPSKLLLQIKIAICTNFLISVLRIMSIF